MNLRAKLVFSIGLLGLLCFILPGSLRADTVYTYTGNAYTSCSGTYASSGTTCAGPYALSVTFDTTLTGGALDNLDITTASAQISSTLSSFLFTDGAGVSLDMTNAYIAAFAIGTDGVGDILSWSIEACTPLNTMCAETSSLPGVSFDLTEISDVNTLQETASGSILSTTGPVGNWAVGAVATPEPSTSLLLGTGLLGLIVVGRRKQIGDARRTVRAMC